MNILVVLIFIITFYSLTQFVAQEVVDFEKAFSFFRLFNIIIGIIALMGNIFLYIQYLANS